ncbi:DinB family protein [Massilia genomosp. 1]|uniref:Damage-inducible protein DinB n=1 Tax=Massilia genomosp. 1 TaxID=2609280 RepID=A0ABX0MQW0_9BURK|nr:DinB family protein [Massilia genomosp. 1]NHZ65146.1 damage-inducible protein DinB [Massilia genomosp. 1]
MNQFLRYLTAQAYNNAWANHRLLRACSRLSQEEFELATRTSFFPSIKATLNHKLTVDWFYIDAMERAARGDEPHPDYCAAFFEPEEPFATCAGLWAAQKSSDQRLIAYCRQLDEATLVRDVGILRDHGLMLDTPARLLAHLFQHQVHHRGQVHAMLAGTAVEAPQLDEFYSRGEAEDRAHDFAELGFAERDVWGV